MNNQSTITSRFVVDGQPVLINLIQNPTIDDVVITEARIFAASLDRSDSSLNDRRVGRDVRDFLIRLFVER